MLWCRTCWLRLPTAAEPTAAAVLPVRAGEAGVAARCTSMVLHASMRSSLYGTGARGLQSGGVRGGRVQQRIVRWDTIEGKHA